MKNTKEIKEVVEVVKVAEEKTVEVVPVIAAITSLDQIVLDTPAKQEYMRVIELYKRQNPVKFALKEKEFIKRMLTK